MKSDYLITDEVLLTEKGLLTTAFDKTLGFYSLLLFGF